MENSNKGQRELDALGLAHADLTERVAEAMQSASKAYVLAVIAELRKQGFDGLTPGSVAVLARLPPDGVQTVTLALATRRSKQATGKTVADLEKHGYAERLPDPDDGRAQLVRATAKGVEALSFGAGIKQTLAERTNTVIGSEAMEQLYADLAKLEAAFRISIG